MSLVAVAEGTWVNPDRVLAVVPRLNDVTTTVYMDFGVEVVVAAPVACVVGALEAYALDHPHG